MSGVRGERDWGKQESTPVSMRFQRWLIDAIDAVAEDAGMTRSAVVRLILEEEFEDMKPGRLYLLPKKEA